MPQQSVLFWHRSPAWWQPMVLHRATPSGPAAHRPEQQLAATAQRSPSELHPPTSAQRRGPWPGPRGIATHEPEQQSMSVLHVSSTTRHPGSAAQVGGAPAGAIGPAGRAMHWPLQQSSGRSQVSPATRHCASSAHRLTPSLPGRHAPPQHSWSIAQVSPAAAQGGPAGPHAVPTQLPPQQSMDEAHAPFGAAQSPAAHRPACGSQNSEQHAPARAQGWPIDAHPDAARQTDAPVASSPHRNEQQSAAAAHGAPSWRQAPPAAQVPAVQLAEQQSVPDVQAEPFGAQATE